MAERNQQPDALLSATAARMRLCISRASFYRLVKRYGVRRHLVPSPTGGKPMVRYLESDIEAIWREFNDPKSRRRVA